MKRILNAFYTAFFCLSFLAVPSTVTAQFSLSFELSDFGVTENFGQVNTLNFDVAVQGPLVAGQSYDNPALNSVIYDVFGILEPGVPSTFPEFNLSRTIGGQEFFDQGSSLSFEVAGSADLSDGLQLSELVADANNRIFLFDGREVDTGRFHPPLIELFADGTGQIQNSNNFGGTNPVFGATVDVDFGDEFIADLSFTPSTFTLATVSAVPEPSSALVLLLIGGLSAIRRR